MVREAVLDHRCCNNLLSNNQFGFIVGRSTTLQLLTFLDECVKTLARGDTVDTVYLDFSKAFDTVPHRCLLGKLEAYGIDGSLLSWISLFLMGRTQKVSVNGSLSSRKPVLSGIPPGSVLGHLLFVMYINDLPDKLCSSSLMFADDTKVFREMLLLLLFAMIRSAVKSPKVPDVEAAAARMSNESALTRMTDSTPKKPWSDLTLVLDG